MEYSLRKRVVEALSKNMSKFRIYEVSDEATLNGLTATRWETVSQLRIGEAVLLPKEARSKMIHLASKHGISIKTRMSKKHPNEVEIIRIPQRKKRGN